MEKYNLYYWTFDDIDIESIAIIIKDGKVFKEEVKYDNVTKCVRPHLTELHKE